jgi:hypothetical protein
MIAGDSGKHCWIWTIGCCGISASRANKPSVKLASHSGSDIKPNEAALVGGLYSIKSAVNAQGVHSKEEKSMKRLLVLALGGLLIVAVGLVIATAEQSQGPAFIGTGQPITEDQVPHKLQSNGWSGCICR